MGQTPFISPRQLILLCLLALPVQAHSAEPPPVAGPDKKAAAELDHLKELSKQQLDSTRELLQQSIEAQEQRLEAQDKRFEDHGKRLDGQDNRLEAQDQRLSAMDTHIDLWISGFGLIAAIVGVVIPLFGLFSVKSKAGEEARNAASEIARTEVSSWLNGRQVELELEIEALRARVRALQEEANTHAQRFQSNLEKTHAELEVQAKSLLERDLQRVDRKDGAGRVLLSPEQRESLAAVAKEALDKPESRYRAKDWDNRAFAALAAGDNQEAIRCWSKVAQLKTASMYIQARATFNKAVVLGRLNQHESALSVYDELIQRFGNDTASDVREQVANAMINKGVALGRLNQPEAELAVYDELIQRYSNDTNDGIRVQIANAMINKGVAMSQLNQPEVGLAIYDELIQRFGNDKNSDMRERVAKAKIGKGFTLLCHAKQYWSNKAERIANLQNAQSLFAETLTSCSNEDRGIVLGNQSYCAHLLEESPDFVRRTLKQALELGDEPLYEATLDDLAIYKVPDKDGPFQALLEEVWSEVQAEKG